MALTRSALEIFTLANKLYAGAQVSIYEVDQDTGLKTATLATLYSAATGSTELLNPQSLDSKGRFKQPVYVDAPVICTVESVNFASHDTGIIAGFLGAALADAESAAQQARTFSLIAERAQARAVAAAASLNFTAYFSGLGTQADDLTELLTLLGLNSVQPLDGDLTAIAALSHTSGRVIRSIGGVWTAAELDIGRNCLINGRFTINQRGAASNADDTYAHDRWYALTQTGAIAVSTLSDVENGLPKMARLTQSQASAQRMGYAQIIEGQNCKHLRGQQVTFRFRRIRCSAAQAIRYAVLEWTGTEDTVTSDVVNDWTSATYTPGNFFNTSNILVSGVTSQTPSAATLTDGTSITATLGSTFNNLIVLAWTEGTAAQNVTLDLGDAQLEFGPVATPFEHRPFATELLRCQRYFEKSAQYATAIGTASDAHFGVPVLATSVANNEHYARGDFKVWKRASPTLTIYPFTTPANTGRTSNGVGTDFGANSGAVNTVSESGFIIQNQSGGALTMSANKAVFFGWYADAEL